MVCPGKKSTKILLHACNEIPAPILRGPQKKRGGIRADSGKTGLAFTLLRPGGFSGRRGEWAVGSMPKSRIVKIGK